MAEPASKATGRLQLTVIANSEAELRTTSREVLSLSGVDIAPLSKVLSKYGASLHPLFGLSEERMLRNVVNIATDASLMSLVNYYRVDVDQARIYDIGDELRKLPLIRAAYATPASAVSPPDDSVPSVRETRAMTPNFSNNQGYRNAGPAGIDVNKAWTRQGGTGIGVSIIHIGNAWRFTHEDLAHNQGGLIGGGESAELGWRNLGTAVLGMLCGADNGIGVTGLCPGAAVSGISISNQGLEIAIRTAADRLQPGDIILITSALPRSEGKHIPVEWWPQYFEIIQYAIKRGILVVAAAGDSGSNLNDPSYNTADAGFPSDWTNPLSRSSRDAGTILVSAGAPPPGTHERDHGPDRSRLALSNFGSMIDAQGWGREVTTCGYGDLQGGDNEDHWYTDKFWGTAAAATMVCGALACAQGILRARGEPLLTPLRARDLLRKTGSPQQDAPDRPSSQRIGRRPSLPDFLYVLIDERAKNEKDNKDQKDSKEHKEYKERNDKAKEWKDKDKEKEHKDDPPEKWKEHEELRSLDIGMNITGRLASLERAVSRLSHFISPDLRPNLATSALSQEDKCQGDVQGLSADLQKRAHDAKTAKDTKDAKDIEKFGEG